MPRRCTAGVRGLVLALLCAAFASAVWIPAAPPGDQWTLTTVDPDLPTGIYDVIHYVDCSANIASALSLNVFATATLGNITGSNLRLLVHTSIDGVEASVRLTDQFGVAETSTVSSLLAAEKCPDIAVDLALDPTLVYTLAITIQEPAGYGVGGPQPHFDLVAVGIDQTTALSTSSQPSATNTTPQPQSQSQESSTSPHSSPPAVSSSPHIPVVLIAAPVAGGVVLLTLAALLFILCRRRRRRLRRGSWISDINGGAAYDPPSARPQWLTYDNIPTITSTGPLMATSTDHRSSTPVQSHASITELGGTSYSAQASVTSPLHLSHISAESSSMTRPSSGESAFAAPELGPVTEKGPATVSVLAYTEAPPAYGPPDLGVSPLPPNSG